MSELQEQKTCTFDVLKKLDNIIKAKFAEWKITEKILYLPYPDKWEALPCSQEEELAKLCSYQRKFFNRLLPKMTKKGPCYYMYLSMSSKSTESVLGVPSGGFLLSLRLTNSYSKLVYLYPYQDGNCLVYNVTTGPIMTIYMTTDHPVVTVTTLDKFIEMEIEKNSEKIVKVAKTIEDITDLDKYKAYLACESSDDSTPEYRDADS